MDRNSVIGLALIMVILIGFFFINQPSQQEVEAIRQQRDSIQNAQIAEEQRLNEARQLAAGQATLLITEAESLPDSIRDEKMKQAYGLMAPFVSGEQQFHVVENQRVKITFSNKGARVYSVELKEYKTHDGQPLVLFEGNENKFGFTFIHNTRIFNTNDLYFNLAGQTDSTIVFHLSTGYGELLSFNYTLPDNEYMANFEVKTENLGAVMATPRGSIDFKWEVKMPAFEKARTFERQFSGLYYKYHLDEVDWLRSRRDDSQELRTPVKWVAFKGQFFSSVFIADDSFASANVTSDVEENELSPYLRYNSAEIVVPVDLVDNQQLGFRFYFGPNHFYTLSNYGKDLQLNELINLGWGLFGWINRFAVIPIFNFLERFIQSYGIIILILTIIIKIVLFPLTYKSYVSSAKMKVLKPQVDEINERIPKEKAIERQQAMMALYKKAGVNPLGGCLPMLLQMPILIAMFSFFPASIELRQEAFLWATDLSSYDSILTLPFTIPMYGAHVSLFTILMTIANVVYTKMNADLTQSTNQMPGMKLMLYMMPVMLLVFFNSYSSGLSYYYFVSTVITIGQTMLIRQFVDEKQLLKKIQANQKKPVKKSKFAARLEEIAKQQQQLKNKRR